MAVNAGDKSKPSGDELAIILDLLASIDRRLAVLESAQLPHAAALSRTDRALLARLLPVLMGAFGRDLFFVADAFESESVALRIALTDLTPKKLGRLLRRAIGVQVDGLTVTGEGSEANARLWRITS